jgi:hypothetical protein
MDARRAAVVALAVPALALGAAACGGSSNEGKADAAKEHAAEVRWRAGLMRWRNSTQRALNGISILFATDGALSELDSTRSHASTSLVAYEEILASCSDTIHRLGPVPAVFAPAGRYAKRACTSLEQGVHAVDDVVRRVRGGGEMNTLDPLSGAGDLLSNGQAELTTAVRALDTGPTSS